MLRVTVGLPVYNDAEGLKRSIPSVMEQRWEGEISLLVIDDGSTDDTPAVLEEMAFRYPNITVVRNATNMGRSQARNQVLDHAATEYLAWIDSDDAWYPDKLAHQFDALRAREDDLGVLCTCAYKLIWVDHGDESIRRPRIVGDQLRNFLDGSLYPYLWTMLGRTDTFREIGRFDERLPRRQDYEYILRFISNGGEIVSPDPYLPLCEYYRTDVGRSGWEVAAANKWIWKQHKRVFGRYKRLYAYDRRATQHALSARFFQANGQRLPALYYTARQKIVEARLRWLQRRNPVPTPAEERALKAQQAAELKLRIFGKGLSVPPPPVESCDVQALEQEYQERGLDRKPDTFVLYRIIGNDLQPRHEKGQSFNNLKFLLEHEPVLEDCEKRWLVNRVFDRDEERRIIELLEAHKQPYLHVPFDYDEYRRIGLDFEPFPQPGAFWRSTYRDLGAGDMRRIMMAVFRDRNIYAMHNNGARNLALDDGRSRAKWILPWDGNCFVTAKAWADIRHGVIERPEYKYVLVPMARVTDNQALTRGSFSPPAEEEPQIIFRCDAAERFNEDWPYGRRPKMELFWRLGVPWKTDHWKNQPWDPDVAELSPEAGQYQFAGWVARLYSGKAEYEQADRKAFLQRGIARENAVVTTLEELDRRSLRLVDGPLAIDGARLKETGARPESAATIRQLEAAADKALARGPYTVVHKGTTPVGTLNDFYFPAPFWWRNPDTLNGLPFVRLPDKRQPGTDLFEEGSEKFDRTRLQRLCDDTLTLAMAHRVTGRADCSAHAVKLLRAWFLDEHTRMTPHLEYAEVRQGHAYNRGGGRGVVQAQAFWYLLEGVRLLREDGALDDADLDGLKAWFRQYLDWLLTSRQGLWAQARSDFHGAWYEVQVSAIAAFVGAPEVLVQAAYRAEEKVHFQFRGLRADTEERRSPSRIAFNLQAWTHLHHLSRGLGRDLWEVRTVRRHIQCALEFLFARVATSGEPEEIHPAVIEPLRATFEACFGKPAGSVEIRDDAGDVDTETLSAEGVRPFWMLG